MPDNYEQSVGKLQNYISDDQICMILSSSNSTTANKMILDCLIERMSCREELLDLCAQLDIISTSPQLNMLISEIRSGECGTCGSREVLTKASFETFKKCLGGFSGEFKSLEDTSPPLIELRVFRSYTQLPYSLDLCCRATIFLAKNQ